MFPSPSLRPGPVPEFYVSPRTGLDRTERMVLAKLVSALAPGGPLRVRIYPGAEFGGHSGWNRHWFAITITVPRRWLFPTLLFSNRPHGGLQFYRRLDVAAFLICHEFGHSYFSGTDAQTEFNCDLQALHFLRDLKLENAVSLPRTAGAFRPGHGRANRKRLPASRGGNGV